MKGIKKLRSRYLNKGIAQDIVKLLKQRKQKELDELQLLIDIAKIAIRSKKKNGNKTHI